MATPPDAITAESALTIMLTVESLLLASMGAIVGLSGSTKYGRLLVTQPRTFGSIVASLISLVGLGGLSAWIHLFHGHFGKGWLFLPSLAALSGLLLQPLVAWWVALGLRNPQ